MITNHHHIHASIEMKVIRKYQIDISTMYHNLSLFQWDFTFGDMKDLPVIKNGNWTSAANEGLNEKVELLFSSFQAFTKGSERFKHSKFFNLAAKPPTNFLNLRKSGQPKLVGG